jgi:site-specific DNA-methyltransferase (adenine-specific)
MIQGKTYTLHIGNNLDILPTLPDNSVDSIVTDPPYELGFMGKKWDNSGIAYSVELWTQCLRVLKPGGHLLSFGGTRTWHRVAVAIEDAGFEVRDSIAWMYGSGFPKSLDVSKAIDKAAGVEREIVGITNQAVGVYAHSGSGSPQDYKSYAIERSITAPTSPEAKQWEGWGTALKPAFEPIVVARKPLIGTVAENVLTHGTGGLNIDGSRIGTQPGEKFSGGVAAQHSEGWDRPWKHDPDSIAKKQERIKETIEKTETLGRWPANIILDEYTAELLDEQTTHLKGATSRTTHIDRGPFSTGVGELVPDAVYGDTGGASRFFYVAKASKRDRNEGLEDLQPQRHSDRENAEGVGGDNPRNRTNEAKQNFHPTVKPTELMRYLIKLVTPPGGVVLDPFTGSGSTGKAAILEGFRFIGCELTEDYIPIIQGRLDNAEEQARLAEAKKDEALF